MVNKVFLIGNLGADPEVRFLENDNVVANFRIATTETYFDKSANERKEITEWHRIVVWGGLAKVVEQYLKKGSRVFVEGKIRTRSYQDKNGETKYITEIRADNFKMLDRRSSGGEEGYNTPAASTPQPAPAQQEANEPGKAMEDDLPF